MKKILFYSLTGTIICVANYLKPEELKKTLKEMQEFYGNRGELKVVGHTKEEMFHYDSTL